MIRLGPNQVMIRRIRLDLISDWHQILMINHHDRQIISPYNSTPYSGAKPGIYTQFWVRISTIRERRIRRISFYIVI